MSCNRVEGSSYDASIGAKYLMPITMQQPSVDISLFRCSGPTSKLRFTSGRLNCRRQNDWFLNLSVRKCFRPVHAFLKNDFARSLSLTNYYSKVCALFSQIRHERVMMFSFLVGQMVESSIQFVRYQLITANDNLYNLYCTYLIKSLRYITEEGGYQLADI